MDEFSEEPVHSVRTFSIAAREYESTVNSKDSCEGIAPLLAITPAFIGLATSGAAQLVLAGGFDGVNSLDSSRVWDCSSSLFGPGPRMGTRRCGCASQRLSAERLLVVGGRDKETVLETTEVLDFSSMTFTQGPCMLVPRSGSAMAMLDANRMLVAGGRSSTKDLDTTEILDLRTMAFCPGPRMGTPRCGCALAMLDGGRLLVAGGRNGDTYLDTSEILDIAAMAFDHGPKMSERRYGCCAIPLGNRCILVAGGFNGWNCVNTTEIFCISEETVSFTSGPCMLDERVCRLSGVLSSHCAIVVGSSSITSTHFDTSEVLNLETLTFSLGPPVGVFAGVSCREARTQCNILIDYLPTEEREPGSACLPRTTSYCRTQ